MKPNVNPGLITLGAWGVPFKYQMMIWGRRVTTGFVDPLPPITYDLEDIFCFHRLFSFQAVSEPEQIADGFESSSKLQPGFVAFSCWDLKFYM